MAPKRRARRSRRLGRRRVSIQADVGKVADARRVVEEAVAALGGLDILVNNAGIEKNAAFVDVTEEDYHAVIAVNITAALLRTQSFVRHRRDVKGGGKVINISSVHEELPFPHFTAYCMAKGGLKMMMRNLSIELAPLGITINNVAPGAIQTPINQKLLSDPKLLNPLLANIPLDRLGQPSDVAGVTAFLASDGCGLHHRRDHSGGRRPAVELQRAVSSGATASSILNGTFTKGNRMPEKHRAQESLHCDYRLSSGCKRTIRGIADNLSASRLVEKQHVSISYGLACSRFGLGLPGGVFPGIEIPGIQIGNGAGHGH